MKVIYKNELRHHGIKGQKWGIRRFQKEDGSRTTAGKKREHRQLSDKTKKRIRNVAIGVAGGAALAGGAYYLSKNTNAGNRIKLKKALRNIESARNPKPEIKERLKNTANRAGTAIKEDVKKTVRRTGGYAVDGALAGIGMLGTQALSRALASDSSDSIGKRIGKGILYTTGANMIKGATKPRFKQEGKKNKGAGLPQQFPSKGQGTNSAKEEAMNLSKVHDAIGKPSGKAIDKQGADNKRWTSLFTDEKGNHRDKHTSQTIKTMSRAGYDLDQIEEYLAGLKKVKHSGTGDSMQIVYSNELYHHGIKGQKWGVRRFQNADGSLTSSGTKRYGYDSNGNQSAKGKYRQAKDTARAKFKKNGMKNAVSMGKKIDKHLAKDKQISKQYKAEKTAAKQAYKNSPEGQAAAARRKKVALAALGVAGAAAAGYGAYKFAQTDKGKQFVGNAKDRANMAALRVKNSRAGDIVRGNTIAAREGLNKAGAKAKSAGETAYINGMYAKDAVSSRMRDAANRVKNSNPVVNAQLAGISAREGLGRAGAKVRSAGETAYINGMYATDKARQKMSNARETATALGAAARVEGKAAASRYANNARTKISNAKQSAQNAAANAKVGAQLGALTWQKTTKSGAAATKAYGAAKQTAQTIGTGAKRAKVGAQLGALTWQKTTRSGAAATRAANTVRSGASKAKSAASNYARQIANDRKISNTARTALNDALKRRRNR